MGILNKREYLGPVWPADVWSADDVPFCSIFTYFQYSLIHDLALKMYLYVSQNPHICERERANDKFITKKILQNFFFHFPLTPEIRIYLLLFLGFDEY